MINQKNKSEFVLIKSQKTSSLYKRLYHLILTLEKISLNLSLNLKVFLELLKTKNFQPLNILAYLYFKKLFLSVFIIGFSVPVFSALTPQDCENVFEGSRREAEDTARRIYTKTELHPQFRDIFKEISLPPLWNKDALSPPEIFNPFLPEGIQLINHALKDTRAPHLVQILNQTPALIVRGAWQSQGHQLETNITFSTIGLGDNFNLRESRKRYLVGPSSKVAVIYLHGGGTTTTGGHSAQTIIDGITKNNVPVVAPDLSFHGEGPRVFMGDIKKELQVLVDFAKHFVHPNVPVVFWGHSYGGSLAHLMMQFSEPDSDFKKILPNLSGFVITSPAIDPAPGKTLHDKVTIFQNKHEIAMESKDKIAPTERNFPIEMALDGKTSFPGIFAANLNILQMEDSLPDHRGKMYLPAITIVGEGDQLVYLGFEEEFDNFYNNLENVDFHLLESLPLTKSEDKTPSKVGHLIADHSLNPKSKKPVHIALALKFFQEKLNISVAEQASSTNDPLKKVLEFLQLYANDLSFRAWVDKVHLKRDARTNSFRKTKQETAEIHLALTQKFNLKQVFNQEVKSLLQREEKGEELSLEELKETFRLFNHYRFKSNKSIQRLFSEIENASSIRRIKVNTTNQEELVKSDEPRGVLDIAEELKIAINNYLKKPMKDFFITLSNLARTTHPEENIKQEFPYLSLISSEQFQQELLEPLEIFNRLEDRNKQDYIPNLEDFELSDFFIEGAPVQIANLQEKLKEKDLTEEERNTLTQVLHKTTYLKAFIKEGYLPSLRAYGVISSIREAETKLTKIKERLAQEDLTKEEKQSLEEQQRDLNEKRKGFVKIQETYHKIEDTKKVIEKVVELQQQRASLHKKIESMRKELNPKIDRIRAYIKTIDAHFKNLIVTPSHGSGPIEQHFARHQELLEEMMDLSDELEIRINTPITKALEDKDLSQERLIEVLNPHKDFLEKFSEQKNYFMQNLQSLKEVYKNSLLAGDFTDELEDIAKQLYGNTGLYSQVEALSVDLAQKEHEYQKVSIALANDLDYYNQLIPYEHRRYYEDIYGRDLLNLSPEALLGAHQKIEHLLKVWKDELGSQIPPERP